MKERTPTPDQKQEAIKWHLERTRIYLGYGKGNRELTLEEAEIIVDDRIENGCPLIGFNDDPQEKWTY